MDIIHKYNADEARNLKQYGELPETARINETAVDMAMEGDDANDDIGIDFDQIVLDMLARCMNERADTRKSSEVRDVEKCAAVASRLVEVVAADLDELDGGVADGGA